MATGQILKQVQIYSPAANLSCTDIISTRLHLTMSCTVTRDNRRSQALLHTMDQELTLSQLPSGFGRYENHTFTAEQVAFYRTMLPLTVESIQRSSIDYAFFAAEGNTQRPSPAPTFHPSLQPSGHPSSQPSSNPTAAPSVSPQPTSQPSSSRPTNTYKPTVKPTQRPSAAPTRAPSRSPTMRPTAKPTTGPTVAPSAAPSVHRTLVPVAASTRCPSTKPTRSPTLRSSAIPTDGPSIAPTAEVSTVQSKAPNNNRAYLIVGYVVAGLAGLWLLYILRRWCQYKLEGVQSDANRKVYAESMDAKPKPRFPICSYIISFFCTVEAVEIGFIPVVATDTLYSGVGANIDGPDLEANKPARGPNKSKELNKTTAKQEASKSDSESDVDVMLSEESSYHSCDYEYEDASSLSAEEEEVELDYDGEDGGGGGADSRDKEDEDYSGEELSVEKVSEGEGSEGQGFDGDQEGEEVAYYDEVSAGEQSSGGSAVVHSLSSGGDRRSTSDMESLHSDMDGDV
uniref:Circumsporozoite protein n=1 Tax=Spumella elongata TaxID=89044 RepID=A0A7S3M2D3_9STRA